MRTFLTAILLMSLVTACNNSSSSTTSADSSTNANATGVDNVNGNIPDTTSGITLNQPLPVDSSRVKDSAGKKDSLRH